jgi:hypothetical protein
MSVANIDLQKLEGVRRMSLTIKNFEKVIKKT